MILIDDILIGLIGLCFVGYGYEIYREYRLGESYNMLKKLLSWFYTALWMVGWISLIALLHHFYLENL